MSIADEFEKLDGLRKQGVLNMASPLSLLAVCFVFFQIFPAFAQRSITNGGACVQSDSGFWDQPYVCDSSLVWRHPAFQFGTSGASCTSGTTGTAGMVQWTGSDLQYCNGSAWTSLVSGTATIYLGTSTSATNPQRNGQADTGFYTAGSGLVDIAVDVSGTPTQIAEFTSTGLNLVSVSEGLSINGINALRLPTADSNAGGSIAIGSSALAGETITGTTYDNTVIGYQAMSGTLTTGSTDDTVVGYAAYQNGTGNAVTAMGYEAMQNATSGGQNTAFGYRAGQGIGSTGNNVAVGYQALLAIAGSTDTAVGSGAMGAGTGSGPKNCALGYDALTAVTNGGYNVGIGASAGATLTTGNSNTIIGYQVGSTTLQTGSSNILIGTSNAVDTPTSSTSSWLNIGNVIAGGLSNPHLTGCGTGGSWSSHASDLEGTVTTGTGATACTIVFSDARANAPTCVVTAQGGSVPAYTTSTTALTLTSVGASAIVGYVCFGP